MNKHILFMILACYCLISGEACAHRLGAVEVTLHGGVSGLYNDNVTYRAVNKKSDFITRPTIGLSAAYEGSTTQFLVKSSYYREFYTNNPGFDGSGGDCSVTFGSELSKFDRITANNTFTRTYEPRNFDDQFGFIGGRYDSTRNRVNIGYSRDISRHIGLSLRYSNEYNGYSRSDIAKSYLNTAGMEWALALNPDVSAIGAYDFTRRAFNPGPDADVHTFSGGLRRYFSKQLYFDGVYGVDSIKSYGGKSYLKPMMAVSVKNDIDKSTSIDISFSKRFDTISYSQDLFNQQRVSAGISRDFLKKVRGRASAFYGHGEYTGTGFVNKLTGMDAELTYDICDNLKADASYSFSREDSTSPGGGYKRNVVSISITGDF